MPADARVRDARLVRVIDGDTFVAVLDLLPGAEPAPLLETSIRVYNWDAAELRDREGPYMRDVFRQQLEAARRITVEVRGMSFQRIVASVWIDEQLFAGILSRELLQLRARGPRA